MVCGSKSLETSLAQLNSEHVEVLVRVSSCCAVICPNRLTAESVGQATFEKRGDGGGTCSVQVTVSEI